MTTNTVAILKNTIDPEIDNQIAYCQVNGDTGEDTQQNIDYDSLTTEQKAIFDSCVSMIQSLIV